MDRMQEQIIQWLLLFVGLAHLALIVWNLYAVAVLPEYELHSYGAFYSLLFVVGALHWRMTCLVILAFVWGAVGSLQSSMELLGQMLRSPDKYCATVADPCKFLQIELHTRRCESARVAMVTFDVVAAVVCIMLAVITFYYYLHMHEKNQKLQQQQEQQQQQQQQQQQYPQQQFALNDIRDDDYPDEKMSDTQIETEADQKTLKEDQEQADKSVRSELE